MEACEVRAPCDDEEYLIRRVHGVIPLIDRDGYSGEYTEAIDGIRYHMWKHENRPLNPEKGPP